MAAILITSSLNGISSMSWMAVWMMMEVNTMALCYLMTKDSNKKKSKKIMTMKYFLMQMLASSVIMVIISSQTTNSHYTLTLVLCLMTKMGAWPFHTWYLSLLSNMSLSGKSMLLILTWQKVLPAVMMSSLHMETPTKMKIIFICLLSLMSPMMKVKTMPNNMVMALSSLNSNSWIITSSLVSLKVLAMMLLFYYLIMWTTLKTLSMNPKSLIKSSTTMMNLLAMFANLSGLPPLSMFWVKVLVLKGSMHNSMNMSILLSMLMLSCTMVALYLNMMVPYFMKTYMKMQTVYLKSEKSKNKTLVMMAYTTVISSLLTAMNLSLTN